MKHHSFTQLSVLAAVLIFGAAERSVAQAQSDAKGELLTGEYHATIETSLGKIEVELYTADAPKTVTNFVRLAEEKFCRGFALLDGPPLSAMNFTTASERERTCSFS